MNVYTENILADIEDVLGEINDLTRKFESNSWEFDIQTEEAKFWMKLANEMQNIYEKLEKNLPF